jgi:hypothetical protein
MCVDLRHMLPVAWTSTVHGVLGLPKTYKISMLLCQEGGASTPALSITLAPARLKLLRYIRGEFTQLRRARGLLDPVFYFDSKDWPDSTRLAVGHVTTCRF